MLNEKTKQQAIEIMMQPYTGNHPEAEAAYTELKRRAGKEVGEGVGFERIRRITGYLVGDTNRWNNAKAAELNDRVKHTVTIFRAR